MTPTQENDKKVPHMDSWKCIILSAVSEEKKRDFFKKKIIYMKVTLLQWITNVRIGLLQQQV